jgi:hypothetical protein
MPKISNWYKRRANNMSPTLAEAQIKGLQSGIASYKAKVVAIKQLEDLEGVELELEIFWVHNAILSDRCRTVKISFDPNCDPRAYFIGQEIEMYIHAMIRDY